MNKVIIASIVIAILGLISFLAIGFGLGASNQISEEHNNESAEIQKLKESAVDLIHQNLFYGAHGSDVRGVNPDNVPYIYEGKIAYIEAQAVYVGEQDDNYITIDVLSKSKFKLNDKLNRHFEYTALLKLVNSDHNWKLGDTFSGYIKVLPHSEVCKILYPIDGYKPTGGFILKFDGDRCYDGKATIHFEEVKIITRNTPTLQKHFSPVIYDENGNRLQ